MDECGKYILGDGRSYGRKRKISSKYSELKKTIAIHIIDFNLYNDTTGFHSHLVMTDKNHNHMKRMDDIEIHIIELKKLSKTCYDNLDPLEKWTLFFKQPTQENLEALSMQDPALAKAIDDLEVLSHDPKARILYEARRKYWLDYNSDFDEAEKKGIEKGIQEGIQEGIEKGRHEAQKSTAQTLKRLGVEHATISKATGLTNEEIEHL